MMTKNRVLTIKKTKIDITYESGHSLIEVEKIIRECFEKVYKFFDFSSIKPKLIQFELMYSRNSYNKRVNRITEDWECAYVENGVVIIFDLGVIEKHSSHPKNEYPDIITHELTHMFTRAINSPTLDWVNEGLAQFVAKQDYGQAIDSSFATSPVASAQGQSIKLNNHSFDQTPSRQGGVVDTVDFDYFLENKLVTNTGYTDFINHSGYRISYLLVEYILETFGLLTVEKIISLPGNADCTNLIEEIFSTNIKAVKLQLKLEFN